MPVLYQTVGSEGVGRALCAIFFLALVLAGTSSLISILEVGVHVLSDFGGLLTVERLNLTNLVVNCYLFQSHPVRRLPATVIIFVVTFAVAIGSAVNLDFLINQVCMYIPVKQSLSLVISNVIASVYK